jgi:hypothetical protein
MPLPRLLLCTEVRSHIGTALSARLASEAILEIGKPDIVAPLIGVDRFRMATAIIAAIDQEAAHAGCAHFAECDLLLAGQLGGACWLGRWRQLLLVFLVLRDQLQFFETLLPIFASSSWPMVDGGRAGRR